VKKIDISINQAKIVSFDIEFNEDGGVPDVTATIGLYAGKNKISTFSLSTKSWSDKKFELPIGVIEPIKEISRQLEVVLVRECSSSLGELASGKD